MWMEWTIPLQKLEVSKLKTGTLQTSGKPLTPLSYTDGSFHLPHLNLLLPPLPIKDYDPQTGKLILSLAEVPSAAAKLQALQESLLQNVYRNQRQWFHESGRSYEQLQGGFQPFVESNNLHLYCPLQLQDKRHHVFVWKENEWQKFDKPGFFQKGNQIRVAFRLQGISYQLSPTTGSWTGRFRVQHRILSIYDVC